MPQRLLRPSIRQSKRWNRLSYFEQSLFIRLLTLVDDFARYEADPELIRSEAFPYGDPEGNVVQVTAIDSACQQLTAKDLMVMYEVGGVKYLQLNRWKERVRADESKYPGPECGQMTANDSSRQQMFASPPSPSPSPSPQPLLTEVEIGRGKYHKDSRTVLHLLNEGCRKHFRETDKNLGFISARLTEPGVTLDGVRKMIDRQCRLWMGTTQQEYLRPETLFNSTKFDSYYASNELPISTNSKPTQTRSCV